MDTETNDLSRFRSKQLIAACRLIKAYAEQGAAWLKGEVTLCLNTHNHNVYLVDCRDNVAMLDEHGKLRKWWWCFVCNTDGFDGETYLVNGKQRKREFEKYDGYCSRACKVEAEG